jgi:site-specific DNA recombinase
MSTSKKKNAIGYTRLSRDHAKSVSLDYQQQEIKRLCDSKDLELLEIIIDNDMSGKSIEGRPGMERLLNLVKERQTGAVVVYRSDRLSRNGVESLLIEELFIKSGVGLYSCTEGEIATGNVDDELMRFLRAGLNQRERKLISLRTKRALQEKRERGERVGGPAPFGYRLGKDKKIHEDKKEQEVIRAILVLKQQGYSNWKVGKLLSHNGIKNRKGNPFHHEQIKRICARAWNEDK